MRGHHGSALTQVVSGIKIIAELQDEEHAVAAADHMMVLPRNPLIPLDTLTTSFVRLGTQICELQGTSGCTILKADPAKQPGFGPSVPEKFTSISEARNCFDYLYNNAIHKVNERQRDALVNTANGGSLPQCF